MFFRFILIAMSFGKFGEWLLLVNMRTTVLFHQLKFFRHLWFVRIFQDIPVWKIQTRNSCHIWLEWKMNAEEPMLYNTSYLIFNVYLSIESVLYMCYPET